MDNAIVGGITSVGTLGTNSSTITVSSATTSNTAILRPKVEDVLDRYELNEITVQHRVQEFELMKLRETNVDYADIIKQNIAKNIATEVINKVSFTKKHEMDSDTHSFRGRVWVFTKEELIQMIGEIRNGI
jgi:lysyl-tRNA synthetase class II